jgi:hypothetical protein
MIHRIVYQNSNNKFDYIILNFTMLSTQLLTDVVRVFQCSDAFCSEQQQLAELSGTYSSPYAITSKSPFMKVIFTSDSSVNYDGFTASVAIVST